MSDEQAKPTVKVIRREVDGIRLSLGTILLILFCAFLIIIATFMQFNITHFVLPFKIFNGENLPASAFVHSYKFIPQIPIIMFITAFLGRRYGMASIIIYLITGLFFIPVFALGGGLKYAIEYGFGYILGYLPAAFFAGSILKSGLSNKNILKAVFIGVLTIHLIGVLYMLFIASIRQEGWMFMSGWIASQSGIKIIYDIIFSFFAMFIARYARLILWFFM